MNYRMTVRTNWDKVIDWVNIILFINLGKWCQMMNMNEPFDDAAVCCTEVKASSKAFIAMMVYTFLSCFLISLIAVYKNLNNFALFIYFVFVKLKCFCW